MVHYWVAYGYSNHQGGCTYGFHHFPAVSKWKEAWEAAIRRKHWHANWQKCWHATESNRLCCAHFVGGTMTSQNVILFNSVDKPFKDPTNVHYIPTLFSFTTEEQKKACTRRTKKHKRVVSMKRKRCQHQMKVSRAQES